MSLFKLRNQQSLSHNFDKHTLSGREFLTLKAMGKKNNCVVEYMDFMC